MKHGQKICYPRAEPLPWQPCGFYSMCSCRPLFRALRNISYRMVYKNESISLEIKNELFVWQIHRNYAVYASMPPQASSSAHTHACHVQRSFTTQLWATRSTCVEARQQGLAPSSGTRRSHATFVSCCVASAWAWSVKVSYFLHINNYNNLRHFDCLRW